jgi:hypothetical protein
MFKTIIILLISACFVEFIVQIIKASLHWWEWTSIGVSVLIALLLQIHLIDLPILTDGWRWWIGVAITGLFIGRIASFIYALIEMWRSAKKPLEITLLDEERWAAVVQAE